MWNQRYIDDLIRLDTVRDTDDGGNQLILTNHNFFLCFPKVKLKCETMILLSAAKKCALEQQSMRRGEALIEEA